MIWKIRSKNLSLDGPLMMGIVNITPDSFSDGGRHFSPDRAVEHALDLAEQGADIVDLGAESTRPKADEVPASEECSRLIPVLKALKKKLPIPVSVDTTKAETARECLACGADIINDVSGLKDSGKEMAALVTRAGAGLVLMHRRGTPRTMQSLAEYDNVVEEVFEELEESLRLADAAGISPGAIAVDPGVGFAKNTSQNLELLRGIERFHDLGRPLLLGFSRKSFIGDITGKSVDDREFGTAGALAYTMMKGVRIFRVHRVGAMKDIIKMIQALEGDGNVGTFKMA